ncbi:MAG: NUDIX hydrolase [Actinomycetota bacterium]|nr:NUDIX hydrolase [Actinomycetota bacterium]
MSSRPGGPREVWAGGAALWRPAEGGPEIALVHRPRYDDWSLPKGKLDPGEHLLTCAAREVEEETGVTAVLGRPLGEQRYPVTERDGSPALKVVRYWAARATGGEFSPNEEVDRLDWLSPPAAVERVTHERDRDLIGRLLEHPETTTVVVLRHASAGSRATWAADDRLRPLDDIGRRQAQAACAVLPVFGPQQVLSADLVRCLDTVRPLAGRLGLPVVVEPALGDRAYESDPERALRRFDAIVRAGRSTVLCTQGDAAPGLVEAVAERDRVPLPDRVESAKGSAWVLSYDGVRLVDAEYFPKLLP